MENSTASVLPRSEFSKPDLSKTADNLSQHSQELKRNAAQVAQDVKEHASASVEYASAVTREKVNDGFDQLNSYIKKNPLTSVVAAVSVGYLIGWMRSR